MFQRSLLFRGAAVAVAVLVAFIAGRWSASPRVAAQTATPPIAATPRDAASNTTSRARATVPATEPVLAHLQAWVRRTPGSLSDEEARQKRLEEWAAVDPAAAMAFAAAHLKADRRAQAISSILAIWGRQDPAAAWRWVSTMAPDATYHYDTLLEVFGRSSTSLAAQYAADYARAHPDAALEVHLAALLGISYRGDFAGARTLIDSNFSLDPATRATLQNFIAGQWARYAPAEAADWVLTLPPGPQRDQALIGLGESWSEIDPVRATQFAAGLPAGEARTLALRQAIGKWVEADPTAARTWMLQTERKEDFDQAVSAIATQNNFMSREPVRAIRWAEGIFDDALRAKSISTILYQWFPSDPAGATAYLNTSPEFTPTQRAELLKQLGRSG